MGDVLQSKDERGVLEDLQGELDLTQVMDRNVENLSGAPLARPPAGSLMRLVQPWRSHQQLFVSYLSMNIFAPLSESWLICGRWNHSFRGHTSLGACVSI